MDGRHGRSSVGRTMWYPPGTKADGRTHESRLWSTAGTEQRHINPNAKWLFQLHPDESWLPRWGPPVWQRGAPSHPYVVPKGTPFMSFYPQRDTGDGKCRASPVVISICIRKQENMRCHSKISTLRLFVLFVTLRSPRPCILGCVLGTVGKPSARRGAWVLFRGVLTHNVKVIEFLVIF